MRTLLRRHDLLVVRAVATALLPVWLALLGFDAVTAFVGELDELGEGNYTAGTAVLYVAYTLPRRVYELFPTAAVIAALLGMGALAAGSELTALRAAGLSRRRIAAGVIGLVAAITTVLVVSAETLGPWGEQRAQALVIRAKSEDLAVARWSGLWAREDETVINARQGFVRGTPPETWVELLDLRLYRFGADGRLESVAMAERAEHRDGRWTLHGVRRSVFGERSVQSEQLAVEAWDSDIQPEVLSLGATKPRYLATRDLAARIDYMERNGLDPGEFAQSYWGRWYYPVNALVLTLAALPFAFGSLRSGGLGKRLFLGVVFGVGFFLADTLAGNLARVYAIDLRVALALPPLLAVVISWLLFRRRI